MKRIEVSDSPVNYGNLEYLKSTLSELFTQTGCVCKTEDGGRRVILTVDCPDCYAEIVRAELIDKIAEVIAVNYKYGFFKKTVAVTGLNDTESEILFASLIAADLSDDKRYCITKLNGMYDTAIDGAFNFRMQPLKRKWQDIASYMPSVFMSSQLKEFITYLLENKKNRAYIDNGRVYDCHYRRLLRCSMLNGGKARVIREVLMSGCGEIELAGRVPEEDEYYLKEFYGDKIYFSTGYGVKNC